MVYGRRPVFLAVRRLNQIPVHIATKKLHDMKVTVVDGDLLDQDVDVIVNAWNRNIIPWWLLIPQGVSGAIKKRGGLQPFRELGRRGAIPLGHAVETSSGSLPFKSIIHVAGINMLWRSSERSIRDSVRNVITIAHSRGYKSLALPLVGAGSGGGKSTKVQSIIEDELTKCQFDGEVRIVRYSKMPTNQAVIGLNQMASPTDAPDETRPKRRWLRLKVSSVFLFTVVLSIFLVWIGNILIRVHHQRNVVGEIQSLGGIVYYDYQLAGEHIEAKPAPGPLILHKIIGDDAFAYVEAVFLNDADKNTDADLAILTELPRLKDVAVYGPNVTDDGMEHIANIPRLRGLGLMETNVTSRGLARLRSVPDFVTLTLDGTTVTDETLNTLNEIPNLQYLQLVRTNVTSAGLAHLVQLTKLRELDILEGPNIGDDGMQHLGNLTNLEILQLLKTSVSDDGVPHLRELRRLKSLNLDQTSVSDAGMDDLVGFHNLIQLRLGYTNVGDAGLQTIAAIHSIQHLHIGGTKVTDDGIGYLAKMPNLQSLRIYPSDVSDAGILRLRSLDTLAYLSVGPHITEGAAKELRQAIPDCHIDAWDEAGGNTFTIYEQASNAR